MLPVAFHYCLVLLHAALLMKAAVRQGAGSAPTFTTDQPVPAFDAARDVHKVELSVCAAAISPVDYKLPRLVLGPVYGLDVAGRVTNVGSEVRDLQVGDAVFGRAVGALAETAVASAENLAQKPGRLSFAEAAALPTAYVTSLQALRTCRVQEGSSVLVIGASGGCGLAGLHLAAALGATRIVAVCSANNAGLVQREGATEVVDYTDADGMAKFFQENAGQFDCVLDTATGSGKGEDYTPTAVPLLKEEGGGQYATLNGGALVWIRHLTRIFKPQNQHLIITDMNAADLAEVASLLEKIGKKPIVNLLPFSEKGVKEGFEKLKSRRSKGKIVFEIAP